MTLEEQLLIVWRALPPEKQREVLDFVEFLAARHSPPLVDVLAGIRRRAAAFDEAELESLVDEAREAFFQAQVQ